MKTILRVLCGITFISTIFGYSHIEIGGLFPSGTENGDVLLPPSDDGVFQVVFTNVSSFKHNGTQYSTVFIVNNGALSFGPTGSIFTPACSSVNISMIVPYLADVDTRDGGTLSYRESTQSADLMQASAEISKKYPTMYYLKMRWVFIVTWNEVAFFGSSSCNATSIRNTFQCILATDGTHSFTIFKYGKIDWTTGTASGGDCNGLGGFYAEAGFDLGFGGDDGFIRIPSSCTPDVINIEQTSNVGANGTFIFDTANAIQ